MTVQTTMDRNQRSHVAPIVHELKDGGALDLTALPSIPSTIFQVRHQARPGWCTGTGTGRQGTRQQEPSSC